MKFEARNSPDRLICSGTGTQDGPSDAKAAGLEPGRADGGLLACEEDLCLNLGNPQPPRLRAEEATKGGGEGVRRAGGEESRRQAGKEARG